MLESTEFKRIKELLLNYHHARLNNTLQPHDAAEFSCLLDQAGDECDDEQWQGLLSALKAQSEAIMRDKGARLLSSSRPIKIFH